MHELSPENQHENPEKMDFNKLNFNELEELSKEVTELAKSSFKQIENGYKNINGDAVTIQETKGVYEISSISSKLSDFHGYVLDSNNEILYGGNIDKEEMMKALKKMIEEFGNRIIE